jgi:hypothetical protein
MAFYQDGDDGNAKHAQLRVPFQQDSDFDLHCTDMASSSYGFFLL